MQKIRAIIVDDERLAREATRHLLTSFAEVEVVGEVGTLVAAHKSIQALLPDLIFLDVELRGGKGFHLLAELQPCPEVVLITAYEEYALHGYDFDVADYLLKPVEPEKMKRALMKVRRRLREKVGTPPTSPESKETSSLTEVEPGRFYLEVKQVLAVIADGNYTYVHMKNGKTEYLRKTMREWEQILPAETFLRIDRKHIINLQEIRQLKCLGHSAHFVFANMPNRFEVGRNACNKLKKYFAHLSE